MGPQEHRNIQQREMQSPAAGDEKSHASEQAGSDLLVNFAGKDVRGPHGHQTEREAAMRPGGKGGQQPPLKHWNRREQLRSLCPWRCSKPS